MPSRGLRSGSPKLGGRTADTMAAVALGTSAQWPLFSMHKEHFRKGEYLFRVGDKADRLFYINKGFIRLPEINKVVNAGQVIGEMGVFSPGRERTASAICEEDLEAYTMDRDEVIEFFRRDPSLAIELLQLSNKRSSSIASEGRSEEHTSELQSLAYLVCRLLLEKKK